MNDTPTQVQKQSNVLPPTPVGTALKEQERAQSEIISPSETEPVISPEVAGAGAEKVSEFPKPKDKEYQVGIREAKESTPMATEPTGLVNLPMTKEEAQETFKTTNATDSPHWLAALIIKIGKHLKMLHKKLVS